MRELNNQIKVQYAEMAFFAKQQQSQLNTVFRVQKLLNVTKWKTYQHERLSI